MMGKGCYKKILGVSGHKWEFMLRGLIEYVRSGGRVNRWAGLEMLCYLS